MKFINPEPGFVVKTHLLATPPPTTNKQQTPPPPTTTKVFVNVCQSSVIEEPQSKAVNEAHRRGMSWSLPHSIAAHREDIDKKGQSCIVYDAVFHPTALRLATQNEQFKRMIITTALDGIESRFPVHKLSRDYKLPNTKFKVRGRGRREGKRQRQGTATERERDREQ